MDDSSQSYAAFVSYRRKDGGLVASWIRRRLQRTELPEEVLERLSVDARKLHVQRPRVFMDTAYERPSPDFLESKVFPALDKSKRLIVVSSPAAFEPQRDRKGAETANWLWLEIDHFLAGGSPLAPPRPIDVVLAPGAPTERFPGRLDENPRWDWIDLRSFSRWRVGPNEELDVAFAKLLAAIYDVPDELLPLLSREERRRRNRILGAFVGVTTTVAALMMALAVYALNGQVQANRATANAEARLAESRRQRADALTAAAGRARGVGDPLASIRLLAEAQRSAITPSVTAHLLASGEPPVVFDRTLLHSTDGAWAIAFRPGSQQLATGTYTGSVRLLDTSEATAEGHEIAGPDGIPVIDLDFSVDGTTLFVVGARPADGTWNTWRQETRASGIRVLRLGDGGNRLSETRIERADDEPHYLSLATSGRAELLIGTERDVRLRRDDGSTIVLPDVDSPLQGAEVALSRDGRWGAASTMRGRIRVWDLDNRTLYRHFDVPVPRGTFVLNSFPLSFSPSGDELAFGSFDGVIYVWRFADEKQARSISVSDAAVAGTAWSPDGRSLTAGTYDGFTSIIGAADGSPRSRLSTTWPGLRSGVLRVAYSDDGRKLVTTEAVPASSGSDPGRWLFGTVREWSSSPAVESFGELAGIDFDEKGELIAWRLLSNGLDLVREGRRLHSKCASGRVWSPIVEAQRRRAHIFHLKAATYESFDGRGELLKPAGEGDAPVLGASALDSSGRRVGNLVAQSDARGGLGSLRFVLCSPDSDQPAMEVQLPPIAATSLGPLLFDAKDEQALLVVGESGRTTILRVVLADQSVHTVTRWVGHDVIGSAAASAGYLAVGDTNGDVAMIDLSNGELTEKDAWLHGSPAHVAFDPPGKVLAVAAQAQLRLFELRDGRLDGERRASVPIGFDPTSLAFDPLGSVLVIGDGRGTLSFWNVATLTEITRVRAHEGPVILLRVSPDGARMVSTAPGAVRLGGGFIPDTVARAERMTRLGLHGGDVGPLDVSREKELTSRWKAGTWRSSGDPAAAEFWRLAASGAIRAASAESWWDWLGWSGSVELSEPLSQWNARNLGHPLASSLATLAHPPETPAEREEDAHGSDAVDPVRK